MRPLLAAVSLGISLGACAPPQAGAQDEPAPPTLRYTIIGGKPGAIGRTVLFQCGSAPADPQPDAAQTRHLSPDAKQCRELGDAWHKLRATQAGRQEGTADAATYRIGWQEAGQSKEWTWIGTLRAAPGALRAWDRLARAIEESVPADED